MTALPAQGALNISSSVRGGHAKNTPPAYYVLEKYARTHKDAPYVAIAGVWNSTKKHYGYKAIPLQFPGKFKATKKGSFTLYRYAMRGEDGKTYRTLIALIPAHPKAGTMMDRWLKVKDRSKVRHEHSVTVPQGGAAASASSTTSELPQNVQSSTSNEEWIEDHCLKSYYPNSVVYSQCSSENVVTPDKDESLDAGGDNGGGGSSGWPDGGGGSGSGGGGGGCPYGCSGGGGGIPGDDNIISYYPEVKYPPGSDYAQKYPKLTEYLKNQLPTIKDNQTIISAIQKYTSLSKVQIASDLEFGKGPTIKIKQLGETYGEFKKDVDPISLYIDIDLVNTLERSSPGSTFADSFSFLIGLTILHEYVHFGDYNFNGDTWQYPQEEGLLFEKDAYGQSVWIENAKVVLKNNQ